MHHVPVHLIDEKVYINIGFNEKAFVFRCYLIYMLNDYLEEKKTYLYCKNSFQTRACLE